MRKLRRATYDSKAKALYIYFIPKEEIKEGKLFQDPLNATDINFSSFLVDAQLIDKDKDDKSGAGYQDVGVEIFDIELEDITNE